MLNCIKFLVYLIESKSVMTISKCDDCVYSGELHHNGI
jgi:hypothetical protein